MLWRKDKNIMNAAVLYTNDSTGQNSYNNIIKKLSDYGIDAGKITPEEIEEGKLCKLDVLVVPGGRSTGQAESLGKDGCGAIEKFVRSGGGYVGICAGAYLASEGYNDPTSNLMLVNASVLDVEHWDRGSGDVQVKITDQAHPVVKGYSGIITAHYENGPLLGPVESGSIPAYSELASYVSDVHQNKNAKTGIMPGSPAIIASDYGNGRCVLFSFHPELTEGLEMMLVQGVIWAGKIDSEEFHLKFKETQDVKVKGAWLWGSTVYRLGPDGAEIITGQMKEYGFTDIFLLVDGEAGSVGYNSKIALSISHPDMDVLKNIIEEAHSRKIKVHAWFVINSDGQWVKEHPDDGMKYMNGDPDPSGRRVSLLSRQYREYVKGLVREVVENYEVDGIHVDYIRYMDAEVCFNEKNEVRRAKEIGIDMEKVYSLMGKTFYSDRDMSSIFEAYDRGDRDVSGWVKFRMDTVNSFAREIREVVKSANPEIRYSASLLPWGAYDSIFLASQSDSRTYADVQYGQNYNDAALIYDFIIPMAYWSDFKKSPQWAAVLYGNARRIFGKGRVYAGLQAYSTDMTDDLCDAVNFIEQMEGDGLVFFRYGGFGLSSICIKDTGKREKVMEIEMTNPLSADYTSNTDVVEAEINLMGDIKAKRIINEIEGCQVSLSSMGKTITITGSPCIPQNGTIKISAIVNGKNNAGRENARVKFYVSGSNDEIRVYSQSKI